MVGWLKWLGGGGASLSAPHLDSPEVTARRVESKRVADLAEWTKRKAKGTLGEKVTRGDVETILARQGFKKRRQNGESLFMKRTDDRDIALFIGLKTFGEGGMFAPSQQLLVSAGMATHEYAAIEREIMASGQTHFVTMAGIEQRKLRDFVLTKAKVSADLAEVEADVLAIDPDEALARFRDFETSRPGSAGVRHIAALALAGDIDTLDGYVRRRMSGDPCGFVPFITDEMIARAAKIGHRHG